eukprot:316949-Pelagomonas_calceolata.AAC.1
MQQEAELVSTLQQHPEAVRQRMGAYLMPVYPHTTHGCTPLTTTSETQASPTDMHIAQSVIDLNALSQHVQ